VVLGCHPTTSVKKQEKNLRASRLGWAKTQKQNHKSKMIALKIGITGILLLF
jgi:hypothetical protein